MVGLLLLACVAVAGASSFPVALYRQELTGVAVCSADTALAKNFAVSVSTDTPTKGEVVYTTFDFDLDAPIADGIAYYDASLNGFPYSATAPLCEETEKSGDPCPMGVGHHHQVSNATTSVTGKLVTKIKWKNVDNLEILCVQITTKTT
jgi:ML domain